MWLENIANISQFSDHQTANTNYTCALERACNLSILGCKRVLELCVGPSLSVLERAYKEYNIDVIGNDIDPRWQKYYPKGKWIVGDAKVIDKSGFDAIIVAPPLSRGCSGRREDSLSLEQVLPSYYDFLNLNTKIIVYVLPGRTLSVKEDRKQLYRFLSYVNLIEVVPLKNKVIKYIDVYTCGQ